MFSDKLTKSIADSVKQITEAKYEPAAPDPELIAKRKAREAAAAKREEERERKENEFGGGEEKKRPTVHKVAGRAYGGAAQKDDIEESVELTLEEVQSLVENGQEDLDRLISVHQKALKKQQPGSAKHKEYTSAIKDLEHAKKHGWESVWKKKGMSFGKANFQKLNKESFSGLLESYKEGGIKSLFENLQTVEEEASEEEFNAELKKQKDKAEGKAPQADVAAAATQGTKDMKEEVELTLEETQELVENGAEQLDHLISVHQKKLDKLQPGTPKHKEYTNHVNDLKLAKKSGWEAVWKKRGVSFGKANFQKLNKEEVEDLEERTLTSAETAEKERIVKGMKKGIEGFKQRYGERAKEVMYATATARAKED